MLIVWPTWWLIPVCRLHWGELLVIPRSQGEYMGNSYRNIYALISRYIGKLSPKKIEHILPISIVYIYIYCIHIHMYWCTVIFPSFVVAKSPGSKRNSESPPGFVPSVSVVPPATGRFSGNKLLMGKSSNYGYGVYKYIYIYMNMIYSLYIVWLYPYLIT